MTGHRRQVPWLSKSLQLCSLEIRFFDLLKALGDIERVVKSNLFYRELPILIRMCATYSELPSYICTMTGTR